MFLTFRALAMKWQKAIDLYTQGSTLAAKFLSSALTYTQRTDHRRRQTDMNPRKQKVFRALAVFLAFSFAQVYVKPVSRIHHRAAAVPLPQFVAR